MPNLPEDIVDRIRSLEREVRRLAAYVNSKPAGTVAAAPPGPSPSPGEPEPVAEG